MQQVKFQAYIKKLNLIVLVERINFDVETIEVRLDEADLWEFDFDEVELLQWTGFKDMNGKEIYEGDVVRIPLNIKEYFNSKVDFNDGCFDVVQGNFRDYLKVYVANRCVKVIGNIHTNPELLGGVY